MKNKIALLVLGILLVCGTQFSYAASKRNNPSYNLTVGAEFYDLTPKIRKILGNTKQKGVVTVTVFAGTPAEQAGLQTGDIIQEVNGKKSKYYSDLLKTIRVNPPETPIQFKVCRQDSTFMISVIPIYPQQIRDPAFQEYYMENNHYGKLAVAYQNNMFNAKVTYWYVQSMEQILLKLESQAGDNALRREKYSNLSQQLEAVRYRLRQMR